MYPISYKSESKEWLGALRSLLNFILPRKEDFKWLNSWIDYGGSAMVKYRTFTGSEKRKYHKIGINRPYNTINAQNADVSVQSQAGTGKVGGVNERGMTGNV